MSWLFLLGLMVVASVSSQPATFENYKVFRIIPQNEEQINTLRYLEHSDAYSFWSRPSYVNRTVDLMVPPANLPEFHRLMNNLNAVYVPFIDNVQSLINKEKSYFQSNGFDFHNYHTLDVIYKHLDNLAISHKEVEVVVGGKTYEGRPIKGVKVSFKAGNPGVFIEGGIHAREWISTATVLYILYQLLHSTDPEVRALAESHDWYIFPNFNPDGYVYTHTKNRLWRKTVKPYGACMGVDPNRNFGYKWMAEGGGSSNPCSEAFAGPSPYSEPEIKSISEYIRSISDKFDTYISFHSYSQLLLFPYGHTADHLENYDQLKYIGTKTIEALAKKYGTEYVTGNVVETIYVATGISMDWVKGELKKPIAYSYELRDRGEYGFLLPSNQIIPTGEETLDSLVAMFKAAKSYKNLFLRNAMLWLFLFGLIVSAVSQQATFENYKVFRILPQNEQQIETLRYLEHSDVYNFWKSPSYVNRTVDLMVPPANLPEFENLMNAINAIYIPYIDNVQDLIQEEKSFSRSMEFDFNNYHTLDVIYQHLENVAASNKEVEVVVGGKTYEGRPIKGVKVSFKAGNPGVFIEGGIHAREWITLSTVLYILYQLLHSTDPEVRALAESHDWYIFPSFNPDGYVYTHTKNRLWRKTVKPYGYCKGTDPNRNFGFKWMQGGASSNPCSETHAGPAPYSEPEIQSMSEYIRSISDKFYVYLSFHSYSQLLLFPYGHTSAHLENYDELKTIGTKTIQALAKRYGTKYVTGNIAETIYVATGGSIDWIKGVLKKQIVYTYELRDQGKYGFLLPPNQIIPTGQETLDSLVAMFKAAKSFGYL
ncbi:uncharacterized protein [Prorops nasuta]|uniref:uncharacterized protein n=1 Tax=Prorops nasuta TaxID=863751 RepID=UPI0034CE4359